MRPFIAVCTRRPENIVLQFTNCLQIEGERVWCAHAINLSSLGVHIKLVRSAVEITAPCPVAAEAHRFQMAGRKWLEEGGRKRQTPTAKNKQPDHTPTPPHRTLTPRAWKTVKQNPVAFAVSCGG